MLAWVLLAGSVIWGLAISTKTRPKQVRPNWMLDLHRYLGGLAMIFVVVHGVGLLLDGWIGFGPSDLLVPFASSWRPGAVAWGVTAMYLAAAVELTSLARRRLPRRMWRMTHALAFPTFLFSTIHGITAGSDAGNPVVRAVMWSTCALVVVLTVLRVSQLGGGRTRPSRPAPAPEPVAFAPPVYEQV